MMEFVDLLQAEFENKANPEIALQQKAYTRNQFEYYGLKSPVRREIQKPFLVKKFLPPKSEMESIVKTLWACPQRENHYFSQEFARKYVKQIEKKDILLYEHMALHKSWWDTIDFIAPNLMGAYFKVYPEQREPYVKKWLESNNIWLQRSALLFQLKYKKDIDLELLSSTIQALLGTKEFFINKAIGWILRDYSRIDPQWVLDFVDRTTLSNLSKREAIRLIK